ncbi:hypothetical protein [Streptomyces sp. NPDC048606]|uniref:hypothetical protein n=1 Tax=Streptomyces sp. NPDC048606 TaxID=3154726 RepID=UPI0034166F3B
MQRPFLRRPKALAALAGLAMAVGLTVIPAQAQSTPRYERPMTTGTLGKDAAPGGPVTREQIIARARHWVERAVPYSQTRWWKDETTGGSYRQDCSGFVSMAWQLRESLTTASLPSVANRLPGFDQLEPGDALDNPAAHAVLFGGWTDKAKGDFVYYSESRPGRPARKDTANIHDHRIAGHPRTSYIPLRLKQLATAQATAPAQPVPTATRAPSASTTPPAKPKPSTTAAPGQKPTPSATATPGRTPSTTAPAAPAPSTTKPPAGAAPGPTVTAAQPAAPAPPPGEGCQSGRQVSFWAWIFSF